MPGHGPCERGRRRVRVCRGLDGPDAQGRREPRARLRQGPIDRAGRVGIFPRPIRYSPAMDKPRLDIAFVSDVACPWCAIGLASLDQALARLKGDVEATVRFEPFELNPDMGDEGTEVVPYLARKYGRTPEQIAQTQARIRDHGAAVGFAFGARNHVWNTFDAHRLLHWAALEG